MKAKELKKKYLDFFQQHGHKLIASAPLIPENDPTVLFTTAGMHPLAPFLLGQPHPLGKRLTDVQKCLRTDDIDEVGDAVHHTFFEMLGNWSLGDYFKKEAIEMSFEFLTNQLKIPVERLAVTCFAGDADAPRDEESVKTWQKLGIAKERIVFLQKKDNWWGPPGESGPCGPDTEMFYWSAKTAAPKQFDPKDKRWVEIWNDVFIQYNKTPRVILIDGMGCMYNENFKINTVLVEMISKFNTKKILVVNGFREKGKNTLKNLVSDAFSLEEKGIKKENLNYFKELFVKFNLNPKEVIYFDHSESNVKTAKQVGIASHVYKNDKEMEGFINSNLYYFASLKQKNVDTGMGVERTTAVLQGFEDNYRTELFWPLIKKIIEITGKKYEDNLRPMRIIADHIRASVFILGDERGAVSSNVDQGYILRRLIRRTIRNLHLLGFSQKFQHEKFSPLIVLGEAVVENYKSDYPLLQEKKSFILSELQKEENKFQHTLKKGLREFEQMAAKTKKISGKNAFLLFQSFGFPIEMTQELGAEKNISVDVRGFNQEFEHHQELSRVGAEKKFQGGLGEASAETARLHTATHLLNEALRKIISKSIHQKGSNITAERLRFDFNFDRKLTDEEIKKMETEVNRIIKLKLNIKREEMSLQQALKSGAQAEFGAKYPEKVSVYSMGDYSKEICMGPHVQNTSELGKFKITKEEAVAAGIRRIKAVLE